MPTPWCQCRAIRWWSPTAFVAHTAGCPDRPRPSRWARFRAYLLARTR